MARERESKKARPAPAGEASVHLPRRVRDRRAGLAPVGDRLPRVSRDAEGNYPAVERARASIARTIVSGRARAGHSQAQLARLAGVRVETLRRIEKGRNTPSTSTVAKIEHALRRAAGRAAAVKKRGAD